MTFATDRAGEALVRCLLLAVLLLFAALVLPHAGQAVALVDLATLGQQRDLGPVLGTVETDQRSLEVELPGTTPAARIRILYSPSTGTLKLRKSTFRSQPAIVRTVNPFVNRLRPPFSRICF